MLAWVAISFGGACLFTAAAANAAMVFAAFFLLRFFGQGALALVSSHALAMWFHRRLGTVSAFRQVALFAAWAPLPALTLALFQRIGWRATWAAYGVVIAISVTLLSWRFVRDRPEEIGLSLDDAHETRPEDGDAVERSHSLRQAMRTRAYWLLAGAILLSPMIGTAIVFDLQPLLKMRGIDTSVAAGAVSAWSGTLAVLAIPSGRLIDRVAPGAILSGGAVAIGVSCLLMNAARSPLMAVGAMVTFALGQSLTMATVGTTAARFFGRGHHGAIRSSLSRIGVIATGLGPLLFGTSLRLSGDYSAALLGFALLCLPVAVISPWLSAPRIAQPG
jgi:sugar phosphate permease